MKDTALIFFSKTAANEAAEKSFVSSNNTKINFKVASLLIQNARRTAHASGLPVIEINEHQQVGNTFGERLSNSIEKVFEDGFENVIVIGNDCPQLTSGIISEAYAQLQKFDLVLGPDNHGGVYLLGINKKLYDKRNFASKAWQTTYLINDLKACFSDTLFFELPYLSDLNSFNDLISIKDLLPSSNKVKGLIISLLAVPQKKHQYLQFIYTRFLFYWFGLTAPPML